MLRAFSAWRGPIRVSCCLPRAASDASNLRVERHCRERRPRGWADLTVIDLVRFWLLHLRSMPLRATQRAAISQAPRMSYSPVPTPEGTKETYWETKAPSSEVRISA